jgi:hypothetical protein
MLLTQPTLELVHDGKLLCPPSPQPMLVLQNSNNLVVSPLPGTSSIQEGKPIRIGFARLGLDALVAPLTFPSFHGKGVEGS